MKKIVLAVLLAAAAAASAAARAQDYMAGVAGKSCGCIEKIAADTPKDRLTGLMGVCILQAFSADDKEKFRKDFGLDFNNMLRDGEKIGTIVGGHMASQCPAVLSSVYLLGKETGSGTARGVVTRVDAQGFVVFSLKEDNGNSSRYLWLHPFSSGMDLPNTYQALVGKSVEVRYETRDIFDPKIGEYRPFKIITGLK